MLGHNLPDEIYKLLETSDKIYIGQEEGKPTVLNSEESSIAAILKKSDDKVFSLSDTDRDYMNSKNKILVTIGSTKDISEVYFPERYFENTELVGRPFLHGVFDCYTLIKDYYRRNFSLILPTNLQRTWEWWTQGENLYLDNASKYGFYEVSEIKKHDVLIMKVQSPVPNHAAIYLGDNKILHHMGGRFSCEQELTPSLKFKISIIYRNKGIVNDN